MNEYIKTWKQDKVLVIQLTAEKTLNALDIGMMEELIDLLRGAAKDAGTGAIVIAGSGRSFCAGADLKAFRDFSQEYIVEYCAELGEDLFNRIATIKKPTLAAVNGYAMGGGLELALACDFRFGHEKTLFSAPEYGFGWVPGWGGVHRLSKLVGPAKAKEILLFRKQIRGEEALSLGLLTGLASMEELLGFTIGKAQELAGLNPLTVSYTKAVINDFEVPRYDSYLQGFTNGIASKTDYARDEIEKFLRKSEEKKR